MGEEGRRRRRRPHATVARAELSSVRSFVLGSFQQLPTNDVEGGSGSAASIDRPQSSISPLADAAAALKDRASER